jgi:mRNA-degrading endonuclease RelE of RelBE toxin-antitoxin system
MTIERKVLFAPDFLRQAKHLRKKHHHFDADFKPLIDQLRSGDTPGDRVPGTQAVVYKVRLKSTDQTKGTRGGFRVVYYVKTSDTVALLSVYIKNEQADLSANRIRQMIREFEHSLGE